MRVLLAGIVLVLSACALPWHAGPDGYMFASTRSPVSPTVQDIVFAHYEDLPKGQYEATLRIRRFTDERLDPATARDIQIALDPFTIESAGAKRDISINLAATFVSTNQETVKVHPNDQVELMLAISDGGRKKGSVMGLYAPGMTGDPS